MKKYLILLIVCLTVALSFSVVAAGGLFGGDDVTVKDVKLDFFWGNVSANPSRDIMCNVYKINFEFVSNVNLDHIKSIKLRNVEVTFDGKVHKYNDCVLEYDKDKANNGDFKYLNSFLKDDYYIFTVKLKDTKFYDSNSISHIKADIVVNTTTQDNIVIGHIDDDISMSTARTNKNPSVISNENLSGENK